MRISALRGRFRGQTAYIVGKGPSLLDLVAADFGAGKGPVITLNHAIVEVRELHLPNPIFTMQKDGCHGLCIRKPCATTVAMTLPIPPEALIVHSRESPRCFATYRERYVFDNPRDFGLRSSSPSSPTAVAIAALMGCTRAVLLAHDGAMTGDTRSVVGGQVGAGHPGYANHRARDEAVAVASGIVLDWLHPTDARD